MRKMQTTLKITAVGLGIVLLVVGWWLLKPLFIDKKINEALPMASQIEQGIEMTADKGKETGEMENKTPAMPVADKETAKQTAAVFEGAFVDGEPGHHAKGKVITLVNGDTTILRLEDLDATNGPDLHLFLAKPGGKTGEGINLGKLKGNIGNQNYELPPDTDLSVYSKVVIYCKQFSVDFGYSELKKS
ncbi:DM13 domain-containing protein [Paenibacillus sp. Soil787]|uniref:DM13 domain-containing protein n=1 Tax=Paenibacillus sp. Soil787 TaxID=1736411 RepID=UPI0006FB2EAE|nr:DM13 domain-containing protein [Paenibacillus sp. Soil787]KRF38645.1 hypothetical protein ASG93_24550 [Paenibacillus sp. Soil787]